MKHSALSIRAFIGAINIDVSRKFYRDLGFAEKALSNSLFLISVNDQLSFYLQNAYVKDWVDNTMIFLEVEDLSVYWRELDALRLPQKYENVRVSSIKEEAWGRECFLHDPSGILWHIGEFY